jgi:hypothetical protein
MDDRHLNYITNPKKNPCNQSNARQTDGLIKDKQCVVKWGLMFGKTFV